MEGRKLFKVAAVVDVVWAPRSRSNACVATRQSRHATQNRHGLNHSTGTWVLAERLPQCTSCVHIYSAHAGMQTGTRHDIDRTRSDAATTNSGAAVRAQRQDRRLCNRKIQSNARNHASATLLAFDANGLTNSPLRHARQQILPPDSSVPG